jgi:transitional endoplasmic reticulum ATPase
MNQPNNEVSLRVKGTLFKDAGRAIARMDPKDMKLIGLESGEVIIIEGRRATPVKIMPCYPDDRDKRIIQIDGITRENALVGIDEKVKIAKTTSSQAVKIKLKPNTNSDYLVKNDDAKYISSLINGLSVTKGDKVRANLFGSRSVEYTITGAYPEGVVVIHPNTNFQIELAKHEGESQSKVSYEDIGGLGNQIQRIQEMIELPLKYPEIFERLGIQPPKGVFIYGPPGSGKTKLVKAVATETDVCFISISGLEIVGMFYSESESRIRKIFEEAQAHAPPIIFINEIEAIAPIRENILNDKRIEKRILAQLLSLMDGLGTRGKVIVIGATNNPNSVDPALRKPGRFDRQIAISIPDKKARLEILQIHTRGIALSIDVDLEKLSEITHGFVGADLETLTRSAAMIALRKILPQIDFEMAEIPYTLLMSLEVTMDNFLDALKDVEPSAIREVFVEVPNVKWDDVGGLDEIKDALLAMVDLSLNYADFFKKANIKPPKGIILHGKPGTGKTLLAKALARQCGLNFISIKGSQIRNRYITEPENGVKELFTKAKQASPCILFIDEIDRLMICHHNQSVTHGDIDGVIGQFITQMEGIEDLKDIIVLGATNRDKVLLGSGLFNLLYELTLPNVKTREKIFSINARNKPLDKNLNFSKLALKTETITGKDIALICQHAKLLAIRDMRDKIAGNSSVCEDEIHIFEHHFEDAICLVQKLISLKI